MPEFKFYNNGVSEPLVTAEEVCLYVPLILCIGTILSLGLGPSVEVNDVLLGVLVEQALFAATVFVCMNIVQVLCPVVRCSDEDDLNSPSSSHSEEKVFAHACSQTEDRNYKMETLATKQKYSRQLQKLARESRATRLTFGKKITDLRQKIKSTDKELSVLQLQIPTLGNERSALLLEVEAVDKQLAEEKYRYDTLMSKYKTFHAQLLQSGIAAMMSVNFLNSKAQHNDTNVTPSMH